MESVEGAGSIPPDLKALYKHDFERSVDLFQKSLTEYDKTEEVHKKAKFKDVMDKALQIMNETAQACLTKRAQNEKDKLAKDYKNFIEHDNPQNLKKLQSDLDHLKESM